MTTDSWAVRCIYMSTQGRPTTGPSTPTVEESAAYAAAMGRAMAEWQFIESGLVQLFEHALHRAHHPGLATVFHVPQGFRTRLEMCTAAVEKSGAPEPWIDRWKKICAKLQKLGQTRNVVSHGITMFDATRPPGARLFLTKNINHPDRRQNVFDHSVGVAADEMHGHAKSYFAAYEELAAFSNYFSAAIRDGFPDGNTVPPQAMGIWS